MIILLIQIIGGIDKCVALYDGSTRLGVIE
jgi:hypothetical protein